jgi:hypothetical protein
MLQKTSILILDSTLFLLNLFPKVLPEARAFRKIQRQDVLLRA